MGAKKKERFPCAECGRITNRNTTYKDLNNAYLCESCRNLYRNNPVCHIPPVGEVHYDENGKIICHICGRGGFDKLVAHVQQRHGMGGNEYRSRYGLNKTQSLTSKSYHEACKNRGKADADRVRKLLEIHRKSTQFKKGDDRNKGRVLTPQALKKIEKRKKSNTAISVNSIFLQRRREAERQRKIQEQLKNQD